MADSPRPLILNVDDNEGARYVNTFALKKGGFEVIEAGTGGDALRLAEERMPDLVLLDVNLPDISGLEVCQRLKHNPRTSTALVLQTSASLLATADKIQALEGGADNFLILPIEPEELLANVRALLRLREVEAAYRRAQSALEESEQRFRQIAENATDVFWIYDFGEKRFIYVNPAAQAVWQCSAADICGDENVWFAAIHPDDRGVAVDELAALQAGGSSDIQYRIVLAGGGERWVRDRGFSIRDGEGRPYRAAGIARDVTESIEFAEALRDSDRKKDEFLATLAHELRNPLAPIRASIEYLRARQPDAPRDIAKAQEIIARQALHLTRLVDDLLDVARITRGKVTLREGTVRLQAAVHSAVETMTGFINSRRQKLVVKMPDAPIMIRGDAVRISQIVGNLLHNAAKYSAPGQPLDLTVILTGAAAEIAVSDQGIGIAAEVLPNVFDLFVQGGHSADLPQDGLGIGLSLVKRLVEMHGGSVRVASGGAGRGSVFTVSLPVADVDAFAITAGGMPTIAASAPRRVLVVDDNVDAADSMAAVLELSGHQARVAYTPQEALELVRGFNPEFVLLDIGLPGMTGYELLGKMRPLLPAGTVSIALTGYGQDQDRAHAKQAGFDHHLTKPVDLDRLADLVR